MSVQLASGDSDGFAAALPAYLDAQLARVDRAGETYDFSSVSHSLLGGLLAARHGEPARAREVLERTRAVSLGSGYPEREALWQALDAELALAEGKRDQEALVARAEALADSRYLQAQVTRLNLLEARAEASAAAEAGQALCAARGQALSEWSFGFSSLVPNLMATRAACDDYPPTRTVAATRAAANG
jgi:hypothetical protein